MHQTAPHTPPAAARPAQTRRRAPALWFLWITAGLIGLSVAGWITFQSFTASILGATLAPAMPFIDSPLDATPDYNQLNAWIAHPGLSGNPAQDVPPQHKVAAHPAAAVFYAAPTAYLSRERWNAELTDPAFLRRMTLFTRNQASALNSVGTIWAPFYRQATFGAFLTAKRDARQALDLAYSDVAAALDAFIAAQPEDKPLILMGHSQGSLHLMRALAESDRGAKLAHRLVAVYLIGWPISPESDLPALHLPACKQASDVRCVVSWQSFARNGDVEPVRAVYRATPGLNGTPRLDQPLCVNPISGATDATRYDPEHNPGALPLTEPGLPLPELSANVTGAVCDDQGFLRLTRTPGPPFDTQILPGGNFHVYDISLFWAKLRYDAEHRLTSFLAGATPPSQEAPAVPDGVPDAMVEP